MRRVLIILWLLLCLVIASFVRAGEQPRYRIGFIYGPGNIKAGESPNFSFNHSWGFWAGLGGQRAAFKFSLISMKNYADSGASGHFSFFSDKDKAPLAIKSVRAGLDIDYRLKKGSRLRPVVGAGMGYMFWKYVDPEADTLLLTRGDHDNTVKFEASELYLSGSLGFEYDASSRLSLGLKTTFDYLTGIGTAFSDSVNDLRGRLAMRVNASISYGFGGGEKDRPSRMSWRSKEAWSTKRDNYRASDGVGDSDGDGIRDEDDKCPMTPPGSEVDGSGCAYDSDRDGIPDGLDDCPATPMAAAGHVDMFGCPVDSDFDGVPDFLDSCRQSPPGVMVDESGCPLDGDGDGVYDGRDDCPETAAGIEVDDRGCIDVAFLRDTMRINIDYPSGSFEVDMRTRERLQPLIRKLRILDHVRIEIVGFTDNVGTAEANQVLSQKRANRMRDWLVSEGIAADRMTADGKGETNFVTSNDTAEGRAKNRRIELIFYNY